MIPQRRYLSQNPTPSRDKMEGRKKPQRNVRLRSARDIHERKIKKIKGLKKFIINYSKS